MTASLILTSLAKRANPITDALIPRNEDRGPFNGIVSDALLLPEGYRRTGRLNAMQEAQGQRSPRELSHPRTARALTSLKSMGLGGVAGGALGASIGGSIGIFGGIRPEESTGQNVARGLALGGGIGGLAGVGIGNVVGMIMGMVKHRRAQSQAAEEIRSNEGEGANVHNIQKGSPWASLVSGMHQTGKADAAESLATGKSRFDKQPLMTAAQLAQFIPYAGTLANLGSMGGSAVRYGQASNRLANAQERRLMPRL